MMLVAAGDGSLVTFMLSDGLLTLAEEKSQGKEDRIRGFASFVNDVKGVDVDQSRDLYRPFYGSSSLTGAKRTIGFIDWAT